MIIKTDSQLLQVEDFLKNEEFIVVDTETDGLNVRKNRIIGLGLSNLSHAGYYLTEYSHIMRILPLLSGKKLILHNAYFDLEMISHNYGIDLWNALHADTTLLVHTVDENRPNYKLKEIGRDLLGEAAIAEAEDLLQSIKNNGGKKGEVWLADPNIVAKYCIKDCFLTADIFSHYSELLKKEKLENFFYIKEVMPLYKEVTRFLQSRGVKVDVDLAKTLLKKITNDINALEFQIQEDIKPHLTSFMDWFLNKEFPVSRSGGFAQALIEMAGLTLPTTSTGKYSVARKNLLPYKNNRYVQYIMGDIYLSEQEIKDVQLKLAEKLQLKHLFNLNSKHHLKKLFFEELKERPLSYTDKNQPQIDEEFLDSINNKYLWVKKLQDFNKLNKLRSTYILRILEESEDGIFYPEFKQHGTLSGRYGSDLQQLPRITEDDSLSELVKTYRNQIRSLFISRNNHKFIDADYNSLEPHIFAHVSNENGIKDIFRNGLDFYSEIAIKTEKLKDVSSDKKADNYLGKINPSARQRAKAYVLGIPYGMEGYKLSFTLGIEKHEGERLVSAYLNAYPNLKAWMKAADLSVYNNGYITSQAGRKRRFHKEKNILNGFGWNLLDSLKLWEKYNENPKEYDNMKYLRRQVKNALNNAKNFQIQSFAASITNKACLEINRYMKANNIEGCVVAQIHDQIIVECPDKDAELMKTKVQEIMEASYAEILSVKLKAPAEIGTNFADAH